MLRLLPDGTLVPILRGKHRVKLVVELQDTFASLGFNLREREKPGLKSQLKGPDAVLYVERLILEGRKNSAFDELSSETNLSRDAVERRYYREKAAQKPDVSISIWNAALRKRCGRQFSRIRT